VDQEPQHPKQSTDESALLRRAKFGKLPARVVPDDMIETAETDRPHEESQEPIFRQEWGPG
jgi:hypothetical protein